MNLDELELDTTGEGEVRLYVYDMTKGLASSLSQMVLGKHIDGIWHTGIIAYGREYFYGGAGIESCRPGGTVLGQPDRIVKLGTTEVPYSLFLEYVFGLGESSYRPGSYDLFRHNCNNFSNEVAVFLTGKTIPDFILNLPEDVLSTPLGESLRPVLESLSLRAEGSRGVSFGARAQQAAEQLLGEDRDDENDSQTDPANPDSARLPSASPPPRPKRNYEPRPAPEGKAMDEDRETGGGDSGEPSGEQPRAEDEDDGEIRLPRREKKAREPAIVFTDVNPVEAFDALSTHLKDLLNEEEQQCMGELREFVLEDTGAWALGVQHLQMLGRLFEDATVPKEGKLALVRFLQAAALKDDVILLLHMDRKDHTLMNYFNTFEKLDPDLQEEIAKLMCNLCQPATASDWMLYISEWQHAGQPCSNNRVTVRIAVDSLLSDRPNMQEKGVTLMYNIGLKEVFDDTATELSSAILQHLHNDLSEEYAFKLLSPLLRFMSVSYNDVPALVKMLGPDIGKFKGKSERVDGLVEQIQFKLSVSVAL